MLYLNQSFSKNLRLLILEQSHCERRTPLKPFTENRKSFIAPLISFVRASITLGRRQKKRKRGCSAICLHHARARDERGSGRYLLDVYQYEISQKSRANGHIGMRGIWRCGETHRLRTSDVENEQKRGRSEMPEQR